MTVASGVAIPILSAAITANGTTPAQPRGKKRGRDSTGGLPTPPPASAHAPQFAAPRRIESIIYGGYEIQALFPSPYPLEDPAPSPTATTGAVGSGTEKKGPGRGGMVTSGQAATLKPETFSMLEAPADSHPKRAISPELGVNGVAIPPSFQAEPTEQVGMVVDETETDGESPRTVFNEDSETSLASVKSTVSAVQVAASLLPTPSQQQHPLSVVHQPATSPTEQEEIPPTPSTSSTSLPSPHLAHANPPSSRASGEGSIPFVDIAVRGVRGKGGRFLPKPEGESIKDQRRAARAIKEAALAANPPPAPTTLTVRQQRELNKKMKGEGDKAAAEAGNQSQVTKRLFVCEGCFKYTVHEAALKAHTSKECEYRSPPGKKVYQRGAHIIWEVDGADAKLWCQNLCLFAKLFIEHKYIFFDIEGFLFYVLTDATPSRDWILGYFSKEKVSYDDYNLACIVTFPPYQKKGYGTLLIEFSYELSRRRSETLGTPERPLSTAGQRSYLTYWTSVIVRYFRAVFEVRGEPPPIDLLNWSATDVDEEERKKKNRRSAGFEGEPPAVLTSPTAFTYRKLSSGAPPNGFAPPAPANSRPLATIAKKAVHGNQFEFPTSLEDIAEATNIRPDDVAFALVESGLAQWRRKVPREREVDEEGETVEGADEIDELVVTAEMVEDVAKRKKILPKLMLEMACVQL